MGDENRADDWLAQATNDLDFAQNALSHQFYAQCCFICQQSAEKALKSLVLRRGAKAAFTHSLYKLCLALGINGELESAAKTLDRYYVSARYPDALPGGAPFQIFQPQEAAEALTLATKILDAAQRG